MGPYATGALLVVLAIAQLTIAPRAALDGAFPSLPLLAAVCWTVLRGPRDGLILAIGGGLLLDLASPAPIGVYSLSFAAATLVVSAGRTLTNARGMLLTAVLAAAGTATAMAVQLALVAAAGGHVALGGRTVWELLVPAVAMNLVWLAVVYPPMRRLARRLGGSRLEWSL